MVPEFPALATRIVDEVLAYDPALAHEAGDHRVDGELPDWGAEAVAARVGMLRDAADALSSLDVDALDLPEQVDHAQLTNLIDRTLYDLTEVCDHEWDPTAHNPGGLLYALLTRPFAPADERLTSLASRLRQVPDALATAKAVLADCPRVHLETAVGQFEGTAVLVRDEVPGLLAQAPALAATVTPAAQAAEAALRDFADWLRARVAADTGRDPRLGRRIWEGKLWHALDTEIGAAALLRRAYAELDSTTAALRQAAAAFTGGDESDATVRDALGRLAAEHPSDATIVDLARDMFADTSAFVSQHELVSLVDDPCEILEMPEFSRGVSVAYCDAPGPLESAGLPTFFCIAPTPASWPPERVASFYREYNNHMIRNLTVHEAMPGHFLQLAHARAYRGSSPVRAATASGPFVEGWAVYAEQMMVEYGYGGLPVRLQQLKMRLRMIINAILDQLTHCEDFTEADAMALMTERGFQEEGEAAGKWRRALLTSAQLSTYFVGYLEVSTAAAGRPAGTAVRDWHDAMLAHGSPAPRHLPALLANLSEASR
ncbi:DUF885 domain-containing protein [Luedemannella helvata]|uniref:DUF885 domain-containing protein n=1 Tax=Luedemannella helvata TaxID=349315 RepID=A0ABP4W5R6_9ACTN